MEKRWQHVNCSQIRWAQVWKLKGPIVNHVSEKCFLHTQLTRRTHNVLCIEMPTLHLHKTRRGQVLTHLKRMEKNFLGYRPFRSTIGVKYRKILEFFD